MVKKWSELGLTPEKIQPLLDSFEKKWERLGIESNLSFNKFVPAIILNKVFIPKENRNKGLGSEFMWALCEFADSIRITITLTPDVSYGGSSVSRLTRFYTRFGFVKNSGRNRNFKTRETMIRRPVKAG